MIRLLAPPVSAPRTPESEEPSSPMMVAMAPQLVEEPFEGEPAPSPTESVDAAQSTFITERRHVLKSFDVYYKDGQDLSNEGLLIAHAARRVKFIA